MRPLGRALIQCDWCPHRRGEDTERPHDARAWRHGHVRTQQGHSRPHAQRGRGRNHTGRHLDLGLPASGTARENCWGFGHRSALFGHGGPSRLVPPLEGERTDLPDPDSPIVHGRGMGTTDLHLKGKRPPRGSWCLCETESHPVFMDLSKCPGNPTPSILCSILPLQTRLHSENQKGRTEGPV